MRLGIVVSLLLSACCVAGASDTPKTRVATSALNLSQTVPAAQDARIFPPKFTYSGTETKNPPWEQIRSFDSRTIKHDLCFAIRAYVFEFEGVGDATRLVDETTCVPASNFKVRKARPRLRP